MRYFYIGLAVFVLLCLLFWLFLCLRRRWARKKVCTLSTKAKACKLNKALSVFGFCYNGCDDTIDSDMYCWQRRMGYCRFYDEAAPAMNMVFDCEPVYFNYGGKRYLLEVWKGQYGCTTGAEIGLYVYRGSACLPPQELFYECANDEERLPMRFVLYRDGEPILRRSCIHWWLTGFIVGMFSECSRLSMVVGIGFPNRQMCRAFYEGLRRTGYGPSQIRVEQTWVYFTFDRPRSRQPGFYSSRYLRKINRRNRRNCRRYCRATRPFRSTLDRISYLAFCFPVLYRTLLRIGVKCTPGKLRRCRRRGERRSGRL
nr:DUF4474 domain-containing protein [uncultured Acetatifactor sp.]